MTTPFTYGDTLTIFRLSETIPLKPQGGGKPRIGDVVRVGADISAVNVPAYAGGEAWYWCIGRNGSGEYGAMFTQSDLVRVAASP